MSKTTKIILIVVAALLLVSCACCLVAALLLPRFVQLGGQNVNVEQDGQPTAAFVDFDLPAGFGPADNVNMLGFSMAAYNHSDGRSHIFVMQGPSSAQVDPQQMQRQMDSAMTRWSQEDVRNLRSAGTLTASVRGQQTDFPLFEGTSSDGTPYTLLTGGFQGPNGLVLLNISRPTASWDAGEIEAFLTSFR